MDLPKYNYEFNETYSVYEFVSEGPKGSVHKIVRYTKVDDNVFNLGFGDLDGQTGRVNDSVVTDTKDAAKVLATVAETVYAFYNHYPNAHVIIKGSTPSRTRLYKMAIVLHWHEISTALNVSGLLAGEREPFEAACNYEAFLITLKEP